MRNSKRTTGPSSPAVPTVNLPSGTLLSVKEPWWPQALGFVIVSIVLMTIYGPALNGPFLFDDYYLPFLSPELARAPLTSWLGVIRPMLQTSYWINLQLNGPSPGAFHMVNLLLHIASGWFVWLIARKLLSFVEPSKQMAQWLAAFTALVFLFHPLQTESVAYVASRSEVQSGLFLLIAWALFLYRKSDGIGWMQSALVLLFFLLGLATKEHVAVFPAVLLLTDYYFHPGFTLEGIRKNWRVYAPTLLGGAIGAAAIFVFVLQPAKTAGFGMKNLTALDYLFTQFRALLRYIGFYLAPVGLNIDHEFPVSRSLGDHFAWLCLIVLLAMTAAAWIYRRRFPMGSFGFLLFLVLLAPTSSVIPIEDPLVERRMYLPLLGLTLVVVDFARRLPLRRTSLAAAGSLALVVLLFLTSDRAQAWSSPLALWKSAVEATPNKYRPLFQLAYAYYEQGRCAEAGEYYARAAKTVPPTYELQLDWALAADCANRPAEALDHLQQALKVSRTAHALSMLGMVYAKQRDYDRALEALAEAEKVDGRFLMLHVYRGNIHLARREYGAAAAAFEAAARIDPTSDFVTRGRAQAQAGLKSFQSR